MLKQFINMSTTDIILHILAAVVPAMILMYYIYRKDRVEKEPAGLLLKLFIAGAVSTGAAIILEIAAEYLEVNVLTQVNAGAATFAIVDATMVGIIEEACKFFFLKRITWKNPNFNYTFDGIVYAVCVSLGFAALENVLYLTSYGLELAVPRGLLAVPGHAAFAVFMGVFYADAKRCAALGDAAAASRSMRRAFFLPVLLHGFYDFCLMSGSDLLGLLFFGFVIVVDIVTWRLIRNSSKTDSPIGPPSVF